MGSYGGLGNGNKAPNVPNHQGQKSSPAPAGDIAYRGGKADTESGLGFQGQNFGGYGSSSIPAPMQQPPYGGAHMMQQGYGQQQQQQYYGGGRPSWNPNP